jgi:hypothetical protein
MICNNAYHAVTRAIFAMDPLHKPRLRDGTAYNESVHHISFRLSLRPIQPAAIDGDMTRVGRCFRQSSSNWICLRAMLLVVDRCGREEDSANLEKC